MHFGPFSIARVAMVATRALHTEHMDSNVFTAEDSMFGTKQEKKERLEQYPELLRNTRLSPAQIAELLGVERSTVLRDLPLLEEQGIYLDEDEEGKLQFVKRQ